MSELVKSFQDAYALPWTIKHYGEFDAIFSAGELRLCYVSRPDTERKRAAMSYLVHCANLMPEAVELLKSADEKLLDLCCMCVNAMSEAGYSVDCKNCNVESLDTNIKELLAKLEGGAEDERD